MVYAVDDVFSEIFELVSSIFTLNSTSIVTDTRSKKGIDYLEIIILTVLYEYAYCDAILSGDYKARI